MLIMILFEAVMATTSFSFANIDLQAVFVAFIISIFNYDNTKSEY